MLTVLLLLLQGSWPYRIRLHPQEGLRHRHQVPEQVPDRAPHPGRPRQAQGSRAAIGRGGAPRVHRPGQGRGGPRGGQRRVQGGRLCEERDALRRGDQAEPGRPEGLLEPVCGVDQADGAAGSPQGRGQGDRGGPDIRCAPLRSMSCRHHADLFDPPVTVKGYIRRAGVLFAMKEFDKALAAIELVRPCSLVSVPSPRDKP